MYNKGSNTWPVSHDAPSQDDDYARSGPEIGWIPQTSGFDAESGAYLEPYQHAQSNESQQYYHQAHQASDGGGYQDPCSELVSGGLATQDHLGGYHASGDLVTGTETTSSVLPSTETYGRVEM
jgi:hypothetical protein